MSKFCEEPAKDWRPLANHALLLPVSWRFERTMPSFKPEAAVYVVAQKLGPPLVVSRTLNEQLWGLMMATIGVQSGDRKSSGTGPAAQAAALAKIHASADTERAEIDQGTVDVLSRACESVLMRASYRSPA